MLKKKKPELNPIVAGAWKDAVVTDSSVKEVELGTLVAKEQIQSESVVPVASTESVMPTVPQVREQPKAEAVHLEHKVASDDYAENAVSPNEAKPTNHISRKRKMKLATPSTLQAIAPKVSKKAAEVIRTKDVDIQAIEKAWIAYGKMVKEADQLNFFSTLTATTIEFVGKQLTIKVLNKLQEEQIRDGLLAISQFMADQVENDELKIEIQVVASDESEISSQFMTDRERYDGMVKKNPRVEKLRKRLDLDLNG
jgi:DNA polymerase-3 subunit gamma/tau